ncbi:hypothetical protein J3R83DRAFT_5498 [Lanmaoa asiatica]|nr:hypothetical protein J3R83DRAFT_5498 [Lanmaoa asiatica]
MSLSKSDSCTVLLLALNRSIESQICHRKKRMRLLCYGSEASKIYIRNEIHSYFTYFGLPHLFFTFNPSVAHSPIFQVMYGDVSVNLSERFPCMVSARDRAIRLAQDPVAAVEFFEFSVRCCFEYLLGWGYKKHRSSSEGGLFGHL